MFWCAQALTLLCGIYLAHADYRSPVNNVAPESQSDMQAPSYVAPYLSNQSFSSHGTKTYSGSKTYGGAKPSHSATKIGYSGTKNVQTGTLSKYSGSKSWYSNSSKGPSDSELSNNANRPFEYQCTPECKNFGICVATNTCNCPANYAGKYCEIEKKPCLNYPPLPMNSLRKCNSEICTITCTAGHKFPDGTNATNMNCVDGQWQPTRVHFTTIPDCEPECNPPCLNGGICLAVDTCNCPADYRGPQCQYLASGCDVRRLAFNGGYSCFGDAERDSCRLNCPAGATFSAPPASVYSCLYSEGVYQPQPIPHCVFTDVVVINSSHTHRTNCK